MADNQIQVVKDVNKWANVLCEADVGDVVSINNIFIQVEENKDGQLCADCYFDDEDVGCLLSEVNCVTPCSFFNNSIGKNLIFKQK